MTKIFFASVLFLFSTFVIAADIDAEMALVEPVGFDEVHNEFKASKAPVESNLLLGKTWDCWCVGAANSGSGPDARWFQKEILQFDKRADGSYCNVSVAAATDTLAPKGCFSLGSDNLYSGNSSRGTQFGVNSKVELVGISFRSVSGLRLLVSGWICAAH